MDKEKKEIGKLLELLNEYDPFICGDGTYTDNHWSYVLDGHSAVYPKSVAKNVIISKSYGFIKWLVENDKIRDDGIRPRKDLVKEITIVDYKTGEALGWKNKYTEVEQLIMYLSIQDEPIRFLYEILK